MIIKHSKKTLPLILISTTLAFLTLAILLFLNQPKSSAADISKFDPGNLMSDATMSDKNTMNVHQIQAFLNSKNACNNRNTHLARAYPHLQYSIKDGKFVCMAQDSFNGKSAAQIIWQAGQDYNINPQVLIVLLEKEQGLISDTWPNHVQYRTAAGFGCPDNLPTGAPPCEAQYFGLENQVRLAANLFRSVLNGGWSNYPVGRTFVQYHPNAACGGTHINIQNRATSALYRYTPYQPNQAALNAGYGTGNGCSAYGNRNFWRLFTDWFGSTQGNTFQKLDSPRWMQIKNNTQKVALGSGQKFGPTLPAGQQIYFPDKFYQNGQWYLRTQYSSTTGGQDGIPLADLTEIPTESFAPRWMSTKRNTKKVDPLRNQSFENLESRMMVKVTSSINVNGSLFYRTEWEDKQNRPRFIPANDLENLKFYDFIATRKLYVNQDAPKIDVKTGRRVATVEKGTFVEYNKRITIGNVLHAQMTSDNGTLYAISMNYLNEINNIPFERLVTPRWLKLTSDTHKVRLPGRQNFGPRLSKGTDIYFPDKAILNGEWYLRTQWDKDQGRSDAIPIRDIAD